MPQDSFQSNQGFYTSGFCSPIYSWLPAARASGCLCAHLINLSSKTLRGKNQAGGRLSYLHSPNNTHNSHSVGCVMLEIVNDLEIVQSIRAGEDNVQMICLLVTVT